MTNKKQEVIVIEEDMPTGPNDLKNRRTIVLSDDKEIYAYRQGPFGMWKLQYEHGMLSPKLKGEFTVFSKVLDEVKTYFQAKGITVKDVRD